MASCLPDSPFLRPSRGPWREPGPLVPDGDDEIHISSVTRLEVAGRPVLRAVVSWLEDGSWVARTVELGEISPVAEGDRREPSRDG